MPGCATVADASFGVVNSAKSASRFSIPGRVFDASDASGRLSSRGGFGDGTSGFRVRLVDRGFRVRSATPSLAVTEPGLDKICMTGCRFVSAFVFFAMVFGEACDVAGLAFLPALDAGLWSIVMRGDGCSDFDNDWLVDAIGGCADTTGLLGSGTVNALSSTGGVGVSGVCEFMRGKVRVIMLIAEDFLRACSCGLTCDAAITATAGTALEAGWL